MARVRTFKPSTRIFRSGTQGPRDEWLEEVEKSVRQDRTHLLGRALSCLCFRVYVCVYARYLCTPACACTRTCTCGPACACERSECAVPAWAGLEAATVPSGYLCYPTTEPADGESAAGKSRLQALCSGEGKKGETQSRRTPLGCSGHKGGAPVGRAVHTAGSSSKLRSSEVVVQGQRSRLPAFAATSSRPVSTRPPLTFPTSQRSLVQAYTPLKSWGLHLRKADTAQP